MALGQYIDLGNPASDSPLNAGLMGWWMGLEGTRGYRLRDISGHGNHGTLTNMSGGGASGWSGTSRPGGVGHELTFDPSGSIDSVNLPLVLSFSGDFTYSLWWRHVDKSSPRMALADDATGNVKIGVNGGNLFLRFVNGSGSGSGLAAGNNNVWTHMAFSRSGSTISIYRDSVLLGTQAEAGTATVKRIGAHLSDGQAWQGNITDIRIYSRALSASEVWRVYDDSRRGHPETLRRWRRRLFGAPAAGGGSSIPVKMYHYMMQGGA